MAAIISDNFNSRAIFLEMQDLIKRHGGYLHERLVFRCGDSGDFSVHLVEGASLPAGETLIYIPDTCLPSAGDFSLSIENENIVFQRKTAGLSKVHADVFELIIGLFNSADKISRHRKGCLWTNLSRAPQLYKRFSNRSFAGVNYYSLFLEGQEDEICLRSFVHSREISYVNAGGVLRDHVLMPFIDFLNHQKEGSILQVPIRGDHKNNGLTLETPALTSCNREIFINYNNYDALGLYLNYGFMEQDSSFVRSIPMAIESPELGKIQINAEAGRPYQGELRPDLQDLREFMPLMDVSDKRVTVLNQFLIPENAGFDAVRRIVAAVLGTIPTVAVTSAQLMQAVAGISNAIVGANAQYYEDLSNTLADSTSSAIPSEIKVQLLNVINRQLEILGTY